MKKNFPGREIVWKEKTVWVIKAWCVSLRLSLNPTPLYYTHICTSIYKLTPPFSIFQLCNLGFLPRAKGYRLTQLKMCPSKPSLQIQYFTLLAGILVYLVKLRGGGWGGRFVATHHTLALQSSTVGHLTVTTRSCLLEKLHEGRI